MMATLALDEVRLYMGVEGHESVPPVDLGATLKFCKSGWPAAMSVFRYFKSGYFKSGYFKLSTVEVGGLLYQVGVKEGDVVSSVNLANIECWPIGDLAERIKETTVLLLGIRRYRGQYSLPTYHYAIVKLGIEDSGPILDSDCSRFADGRYYRDVIPYLSLEFKPYNTFRYMDTVENVSIKAPGKGGVYLAITNGAPTFQEGKYEFNIYRYVPNESPVLGYFPVVIASSTKQLALYNEDCSLTTRAFSEQVFTKLYVPGSDYIFGTTQTENPKEFHIQPYQDYRSGCDEFNIYRYVPNESPVLGYFPVVIASSTKQLALYNEDCSLTTRAFSEQVFTKLYVPGSDYIFGTTQTENPKEFHIQPYQDYRSGCGVLTLSVITQEKVPTMQPLNSPGTQTFEFISNNFDLGNPGT